MIDSSICKDKVGQKDLLKAKHLQIFLENHTHSSRYMLQVKKCGHSDCNYCQEHPVRIPERIFSSCYFLPLPRLDISKEQYKEFGAVCGQAISEDCHSHYPLCQTVQRLIKEGKMF